MKNKIREMKERLWPKCMIMLGLFVVTFVFMSQSPLNILLLNGNSQTDSSVFRTIAMQMQHGLMPYRDSFDHKGPLIYLYNYLGILIRPARGIWCVEFVSAFAAFGLMYKIARLKCDRLWAFFVLLICVAPLYVYFEGGNLTEEYALPYIAAATYIFADYFLNKKISRIRLIICGLSFGAVCLLRINMVAVWIAFCCAVLLQGIFTKHLYEIPDFLLWFLIGAGIITIPVCFWLVKNNAFADFIKDYFVFNKMYTQDASRASSISRYYSFIHFFNNIYVLTAIIVSCYLSRDRKLFHNAYIVYEIIGLLLICLSGQTYAHYGMVLIPMFVYPFSMLLSKEMISKNSWVLAFVMYLSVSQVIPSWIGGVNHVAEYYFMENKTRERNDAIGKVCSFIKENTKEDDRIIVWGNLNIIYVQSQRLPASKYSYQAPIGSIDEEIMTEFFEEINETIPRIVVALAGDLGEMGNFLSSHQYMCVYETDGITLYMQDKSDDF